MMIAEKAADLVCGRSPFPAADVGQPVPMPLKELA